MIPKIFFPYEYYDDIYQISAKKLSEMGIKAVILDIDNTLVTYDDACPTESVLKWFDGLKENDIKISFVSNNNEERVATFNKKLGFPYFANSHKPSPQNYIKAMEILGTDKNSTLAVGDQIFTDVWAASRAGMKTILVKPIKDKKTLLFRFKRSLEKPVLKYYLKKRPKGVE